MSHTGWYIVSHTEIAFTDDLSLLGLSPNDTKRATQNAHATPNTSLLITEYSLSRLVPVQSPCHAIFNARGLNAVAALQGKGDVTLFLNPYPRERSGILALEGFKECATF